MIAPCTKGSKETSILNENFISSKIKDVSKKAKHNEKMKKMYTKNSQNNGDLRVNKRESTDIEHENKINETSENDRVKMSMENPSNSLNENLDYNSSKKHSPTGSVSSFSISVTSIDENAVDSSIFDSESDCEDANDKAPKNYIIKKLGDHIIRNNNGSDEIPNQINEEKTHKITTTKLAETSLDPTVLTKNVLASQTSTSKAIPHLSNIALTNSTDVTFGDKHFYEGPVTIQQFLIQSQNKQAESQGQVNGGFENEETIKQFSNEDNATKKSSPLSSQQHSYPCTFYRKILLVSGILILLTVAFGGIFAALNKSSQNITKSKLIGDGDDSRKNIPTNSTIGKDNIGSGKVLRIVPRDAWLAQPSSKPLVPLSLPVDKVIVLATKTDICTTQAACTYRVRFIQTFNIESTQHDDIIYNFLIGGDGNVYEGRGWDFVGAHLNGFNSESISLAFIGTFKDTPPNDKQLNVTKLLLAEGLKQGKLEASYTINGANTLQPTLTDTSSNALYKSFIGWPHWAQ